MLHVICNYFLSLFSDKILEQGSVIHEAYPVSCFFLRCFFDFTKHPTLEKGFATSILLMMGELAGGGSVDVTRNM